MVSTLSIGYSVDQLLCRSVTLSLSLKGSCRFVGSSIGRFVAFVGCSSAPLSVTSPPSLAKRSHFVACSVCWLSYSFGSVGSLSFVGCYAGCPVGSLSFVGCYVGCSVGRFVASSQELTPLHRLLCRSLVLSCSKLRVSRGM
jgi:hypothetical protein